MISAGPVSPTCSWHIRSAFGVSRVLFPMTADEQGSLDLGLTANSVCRGSDTSVNDYITCKNAGRAQRQPVNVCFYTLNVNPFIANSGANWPNRHLFAQHAVVMPQPVTCCYITVNVQGSGPFHVYTVVYQQWTEQLVAANGNVSACINYSCLQDKKKSSCYCEGARALRDYSLCQGENLNILSVKHSEKQAVPRGVS